MCMLHKWNSRNGSRSTSVEYLPISALSLAEYILIVLMVAFIIILLLIAFQYNRMVKWAEDIWIQSARNLCLQPLDTLTLCETTNRPKKRKKYPSTNRTSFLPIPHLVISSPTVFVYDHLPLEVGTLITKSALIVRKLDLSFPL